MNNPINNLNTPGTNRKMRNDWVRLFVQGLKQTSICIYVARAVAGCVLNRPTNYLTHASDKKDEHVEPFCSAQHSVTLYTSRALST